MRRFLSMLVVLGSLAVATGAPAACRRFGTQLDCNLAGRQLVIGTQAATEPRYGDAFRPELLGWSRHILERHPAPTWPLRVELQNVGIDPGLCWTLGNETYCY